MNSTPGPALSRRHAAGAGSARGLLFTVLGELVLPAGGVAWTSALIDVLGRLGVEEKACRQALMRTAADGWLRSERVGRRTRWWLTPAADTMLTDGTARIYSFPSGVDNWDGRWLVVLARVPETDRPARHRLRTGLAWAGLGSPSPGAWLSPHVERFDEVRSLLSDAGILPDAQIFVGTYAGGADVATTVRAAWALDAIEASYEQFLRAFDAQTAADPVARLIELVHAWRRFPATDPALPRELLPQPWSGEAAAALFRDRHDRWAPAARATWRRLGE
jgi:phenylacetic acid degradation operon negative regulatory protein